MLDNLKDKIRGAVDKITKAGYVDEKLLDEAMRDIQRAFIAGDVDITLVSDLTDRIKERALNEKPKPGMSAREHVVEVVYQELVKFLGEEKPEIKLKPKKILLAGLFGSGKTTTAGKLAKFYKDKGLKPALIACDTIRPAAFEQLQQLAEKLDVPFYGEENEEDSSKVMKNGLKELKDAEVIIADSSGRNALNEELKEEIKSLNDIMNPDERILVVPADIGQAAKKQAKAFHDTLGITDVIVTKMDSTAKGGGALTACYETGAKVKFIGVGEGVNDLEVYEPKRFVGNLIGFPDLKSLLEKAKKVSTEDTEKKAKKIMSGDFTIDDLVSQIEQMNKMGPLSQIMDKMGMGGKLPTDQLNVQQEKMENWTHIINSMTEEEKKDASIVKAGRIERIAKGSGASEQEVRELIAQYKKMKKMMKKFSPGQLKRGQMKDMFKNMGGMMG